MRPDFDGVYQDVLVDGHLVHKGRECASRLDMIRPHIRPGSRVLDVGSHSGYFAIELARRGCTVDSFECHDHMRQVQEWAIEENGVQDLVTLHAEFDPDAPREDYDAVLLLAVLQYFPEGFLEDATRPGERVFIEFPTPDETEAMYHDLVVKLSPFEDYLRTIFNRVILLGKPPAPYMAGVTRRLWLCEK